MSQSELKGFICADDNGREYTVIEYRPPKPQKAPNPPESSNATGSVRFFRTTKGLEVIQIDSTTFKIVKTGQFIKSEIMI
jgi:hypothetical protein